MERTVKLKHLVDTSASKSVISRRLFERLGSFIP
ncbi:MAG: retroviral-like aspartic protease family protein [archaeon YNP-LCB-003-016]|nr:retroviral-like aspartic protease family protein [Candidatus Culexarchaeum yellowstonense]